MVRTHIVVPTEYTQPELKMHRIISGLKVPFLSQEPIHVSGKDVPYVADFLIMRAIIIEVDGIWHLRGKQPMKDERRDEAMKKLRLRILRFDTETIDENPSVCAEKIRAEIERLPLEVKVAAQRPAGHDQR